MSPLVSLQVVDQGPEHRKPVIQDLGINPQYEPHAGWKRLLINVTNCDSHLAQAFALALQGLDHGQKGRQPWTVSSWILKASM